MRTIVRSTALTLVALALALVLPNTASAACEGFADVPEDAACYESVMYLAEHGITKGTEANTFSPAQPVTVRQWAVIAAAYFSIYAYQELKKQLEDIGEMRFIFTSPTFITEKTPKAQRSSWFAYR